ncbi:MAG: DUF6328 family protein [Elusimicrobiota bacterium]|nr:MAG: DUF6328 family protein [Elusimicrobiota bacterium]
MSATVHRNTLEEEARHILEECRVVTPGIQTMIGFQMIVLFNSTFDQKLDADMRLLHLGAMGVVLVAMFLLLTPAAYHRLAEPGEVSRKFVDSASRLLRWAMAFLRLGLAAEMHVVCRALGLPTLQAAAIAAFFFALAYVLWSVYPRVSAMRAKSG